MNDFCIPDPAEINGISLRQDSCLGLVWLISAIDLKAQNILSQRHPPLSVGYSSESWNISVAGAHGSADSFDVADVIFHMSPASQLTIPNSSLFRFLGEPESHLNWAFTASGIYTLNLQAEATRVSDGSPIIRGDTLHLRSPGRTQAEYITNQSSTY